MFNPLRHTTKLAAAFTLCGVCLSPVAPVAQAQVVPAPAPVVLDTATPQPQPALIDTTENKPLVAHCGMEGCPVTATQLASSTKQSARSVLSDSLWGNLVLNMAFQRDPELQSIAKKLGMVDVLTLTSVAAISVLGVAQGADILSTLQDEPHPKHPVVLGMVGTGTSLVTLGARIALNHHYRKVVYNRQLAIKQQVDAIIDHYTAGQATELDKQALVSLIGTRATLEFNDLWQDKHPASAAPANAEPPTLTQ